MSRRCCVFIVRTPSTTAVPSLMCTVETRTFIDVTSVYRYRSKKAQRAQRSAADVCASLLLFRAATMLLYIPGELYRDVIVDRVLRPIRMETACIRLAA